MKLTSKYQTYRTEKSKGQVYLHQAKNYKGGLVAIRVLATDESGSDPKVVRTRFASDKEIAEIRYS